MKFVVANDPNQETVLQWSMHIDDDGDVNLAANGQNILYVSVEDGKVHRYSMFDPNLPLTFDDETGHIELAN